MTSQSDSKPQQASVLSPMDFPLHGARLIEASAGTGKTFTIAGLYLRLLLGHGESGTSHPCQLTVDQILVVTFTEAATAELRDRIRAKIHDARLAFSRGGASSNDKKIDPVIQPLLSAISDHKEAAKILLQAERQMDEAAIYTIHGFCQRMLTQNAFESGSRFNHEFVTDETQLKAKVVADYWRRQFYPLSMNLAAEIGKIWGAPSALLKDVSRHLTGADIELTVAPLSTNIADLHQQNLSKIDELKAQWRAAQDDLQDLISSSDVNKRSYTKKSLPTWLEQVAIWAASPTVDYVFPDKLEKFSQTMLNEKTPKGEPPTHPVFDLIDEFISQSVSLRDPILAHAIAECRVLLAKAKQRKNWLSFDDLLTQLSAALDADEDDLLAERIRTLYPVAMIDEFQDTDPLQYQIFSQIYVGQPQTGLFMIGDPKQAIYGFRGADIFTYIKARNEVQDHYTLGTNWRSSADMVMAVNRIFDFSDAPFIYDEDIPFRPVNFSPKADSSHWFLDGVKQPALRFWLHEEEDGKPVTKGDYLSVMASATASQIQTVLTASDKQQAWFENGGERNNVQAGDIAVLVRTGTEGRKIKEALAEQGIASVYLSNRDSVFDSVVAHDVQRLLQAVLTPEQDKTLRACLASSLFALNARELDALNNEETLWENTVNEFREYRKLWQQRGVMPMIRSVMSKRTMAERLLEEDNGERTITDLLHIGELLQQASLSLESDHGLLRWLSETISDIQSGLTGGSDEQIQRLESERNLVQIVTIHKSKGLEYDLVFLPFVSSYREASEGKYYDAKKDKTVLDITKNSEALELADKERLAEDLRLIYVALTRAVYGCFIGMTPIRKGRATKGPSGLHLSAIGYLVQNGEPKSPEELAGCLVQVTNNHDFMTIDTPPEQQGQPYTPVKEAAEVLTASELQQDIDRSWRISSYSGLVKQSGHGAHDASFEVAGFDIDSFSEEEEHLIEAPARSIFTFPRGARPGTFLHTLFEEVIFNEPAHSEANSATITHLMEVEQLEPEWQPILELLVDTVLNTPLDGEGLQLSNKMPNQLLVEMEFLLPIDVLLAPTFNQLAHQHDPLSKQAGDLGFHRLKGMLKGFIDLVFEHNGKYYVLDWKSNHLGDSVADYHGENLARAMADHRYDLQYQIYALALHRFLKSRLAQYDYEQHFGGVYYLFLRGVDGQSNNGIFSAKPSQAFLEQFDKLIDGEALDV
ncbi:exodeoxyribonuclease V subunit beta [Vibrio penaeicida]|uniref:RecBCD enzyme subunit RecB n=1 Tax=Vibrio penaeicida TaxID=104609 RepID=A0AAV5NLJ1_9VIBR|nr:exodeoxyribonuclease V subunit beta [Vibrio penaeicida]RTZ22527.1 exodeoxyribonuclease V subunit beta [Vibrio penaeicida]GLQ71481.1 RecBCD enzyme subunit RecB [Vibrio penaeicida]